MPVKIRVAELEGCVGITESGGPGGEIGHVDLAVEIEVSGDGGDEVVGVFGDDGDEQEAGVELLVKRGKQKMVTANLMDKPEVAAKMRLIKAPKRPDAYAKAWNEVLAAQ